MSTPEQATVLVFGQPCGAQSTRIEAVLDGENVLLGHQTIVSQTGPYQVVDVATGTVRAESAHQARAVSRVQTASEKNSQPRLTYLRLADGKRMHQYHRFDATPLTVTEDGHFYGEDSAVAALVQSRPKGNVFASPVTRVSASHPLRLREDPMPAFGARK